MAKAQEPRDIAAREAREWEGCDSALARTKADLESPSDVAPPIRRVAEWESITLLRNPDEIHRRSSLVDQLFDAVSRENHPQIAALLGQIPAEIEHYDPYFPPDEGNHHRYATLRTRAQAFDGLHPSPSSQRLLAFIDVCQQRASHQKQVALAQAPIPLEQIQRHYPQEVQQLLLTLRDSNTLAAEPDDFAMQITHAMTLEGRDFVTDLARQPYASLRAAHLHCTRILSRLDTHQELVLDLRRKIEMARQVQSNASVFLRVELLKHPVDRDKVASLALVEYAKQMTSVPVDYVSSDATWGQVATMQTVLRDVYTHYAEDESAQFKVERAALEWVWKQVRKTNSHAPWEPANGEQHVKARYDRLTQSLPALAETRSPGRTWSAAPRGQGRPQRSQTVQPGQRPAFSGIADAILRAQTGNTVRPPTSTGPDLRSVSEWTIANDLTDAHEILQRASALNDVLFQLEEGNAAGLTAALEKIPPEVGHYEHYFPPAPMDLPYGHLHALARMFADLNPSLASDRLLILIGDCHQRQEAQTQVALDLHGVSSQHFNRKYAPDLQALCWTLRETPELDLREKAEGITSLTERLLASKDRDLVRELASQPQANLRMVWAKCTVLAANADRASPIVAFRSQVEVAREMQKNASALLRKELLEDTLDPEKIAALALVEYAKQTTSIAIDYVSAGTSWAELPVMHEAIRTVRAHYASKERASEFPLELASLDWVSNQIGYTLSLPH